MRYCTCCGHELVRLGQPGSTREQFFCSTCQVAQYDNPKVLVACLVYWRDQIVLCRRAIDPAKGYWYPPTGFVESGETLEAAAVRELYEEVGLELAASQMMLYGVASLPHLNEIYVAYRCELSDQPTLVPGDETLEAALFTESMIPAHLIAFGRISNHLLKQFFRQLRTGRFRAHSVTLDRPSPLPGHRGDFCLPFEYYEHAHQW